MVHLAVLAIENIFTHHLKVLCDHCLLTPHLVTNVIEQYSTPYPLVHAAATKRVSYACPPTKFVQRLWPQI